VDENIQTITGPLVRSQSHFLKHLSIICRDAYQTNTFVDISVYIYLHIENARTRDARDLGVYRDRASRSRLVSARSRPVSGSVVSA
jgi:hypothetical protein